MNTRQKRKKSPYFIINTVLLIVILFILIGYLNKINSLNKNNLINNSKKDFFSTFDNPVNKIEVKKEENIDKNIIKEKGKYIKIVNSCDIHFNGGCARARACPSLSCPTVVDLRNHMVLKTDGEITNSDGIEWYHIVFDEWIRYPDRTARDWYVSSDYLEEVDSYTEKLKDEKALSISQKKIVIKLKEQKLYAYDGDKVFMDTYISSGLDDLPTPTGEFKIFQKTPSRYMQGPIPGVSNEEYDMPGVPWTMYFTHSGAAIHGAYWHENFGEQWSHGCINLNPYEAERLYSWADAGTKVIIEK